MLYLPSILAVNFYFDKRRALATGFAMCAAGVGTFAFPPLEEKLLTVYGWQGAIWILAGMVLNCVMFSSLYRPIYNDQASIMASDVAHDSDDNDLESENVRNICATSINDETKYLYNDATANSLNITDELAYKTDQQIYIKEKYQIQTLLPTSDMPGGQVDYKKRQRVDKKLTDNFLTTSDHYSKQNVRPLGVSSSSVAASHIPVEYRNRAYCVQLKQILKLMKDEFQNIIRVIHPDSVFFALGRFALNLGKSKYDQR